MRIERAAFNIGTEYASALRYYGDFLNMCDKQGFGWLSNDFNYDEMFQRTGYERQLNYAGSELTVCADGLVLNEMLQLYQSYMQKPIVLK